jgi:prepilin-type processing-associated H-X9-DG protein
VYHIIGSDQKEYGPVSTAQIRQWFAEGRVHRATAARPANETEWKTLGVLAEFADMCPPPPGLTPPTPVATENCGLATWALVCGAVGIVTCVTAPVGLVLGFVAHSRIRASNGRLTGSGMATTGIVLSLIAVLLWLLAIPAAVLLPALAKARAKAKWPAQSIVCANNLKQLGFAVQMYESNHNDQLPPPESWCDAIQKEVGSSNVFQCPAVPEQRCAYAFNQRLGGKRESDVNPQTVMIFESDAGWNASGGPELLLKSSRHMQLVTVGFADGHVERVTEAQLRQLRWDP